MKKRKPGFYPGLLVTVFLLLSTIMIPGCGSQEPEEPEVPPEVQVEFLEWAHPLYEEIERSDVNWQYLSKDLSDYTNDRLERETMEEITRESIDLHEELLDSFNAISTDNEEKQILIELSKDLFSARLIANQEIQEHLDKGEKPGLDSEVYKDVREGTKQLATKFEEIMKQYDIVWAHLSHYDHYFD